LTHRYIHLSSCILELYQEDLRRENVQLRAAVAELTKHVNDSLQRLRETSEAADVAEQKATEAEHRESMAMNEYERLQREQHDLNTSMEKLKQEVRVKAKSLEKLRSETTIHARECARHVTELLAAVSGTRSDPSLESSQGA